MKRIGLALSPGPSLSIERYWKLLRQAEDYGYEILWTGESNGIEIFSLLGAVLTQTKRLKVSPGIASIYIRPAPLLAMAAATLHMIGPERVILGLGVSTRIVTEEWQSIPWNHPLGRLREYTEVLRRALTGERVNFQGRYYTHWNFRLGLAPTPHIPIYIAALNPQMLRLAGEIADGVLLNWVSPTHAPAVLREITQGAEKAGRRLEELDIACYVRTCVTDDREAARDYLRRHITGYAVADVYSQFFRRLGYTEEIEGMEREWKAGNREAALAHISDEMVETLGVLGSAKECQQKFEALIEAGINQPVVVPFTVGSDPGAWERTVQAFAR